MSWSELILTVIRNATCALRFVMLRTINALNGPPIATVQSAANICSTLKAQLFLSGVVTIFTKPVMISIWRPLTNAQSAKRAQ